MSRKKKVKDVNAGKSYIGDVSSGDLQRAVSSGRLEASTDFAILKDVDTINICVPTPLRKTRDPDISYIVNVVSEIAKHIHKGQLVILESTTYPGTTEEVILPMLEKNGLQSWRGFFPGFFAGTCRSRKRRLPYQEYPQSGWRGNAPMHENGIAAL